MCTATLIPLLGGVRLAFNRDESPTRPAAWPPQTRTFGSRRAVLPIDPISDGTWIAVNDAGLVMALLNRNPTPPSDATYKASRGAIIPSLLHCDNLTSAKNLAVERATHPFAPFRLILCDRHAVVELAVRDHVLNVAEHPRFDAPLMFTSSGLGDELVRQPRQQLFDEMFRTDANWTALQEAFQRHSWPDRRHVSVCMLRERARTVSYTVIELTGSATMTYYPQPPDQPGPAYTLSL